MYGKYQLDVNGMNDKVRGLVHGTEVTNCVGWGASDL